MNLYARFEKDSRYFVLHLTQDLFGDWLLTKVNGQINARLGNICSEGYASLEDAMSQYHKQFHYRTLRRGYRCVNEEENNFENESFKKSG